MKITHVEVSMSDTLNIGNYENINPGFSVRSELEEGESIEEVRSELTQIVMHEWTRLAVAQLKIAIRTSPTETKDQKAAKEHRMTMLKSLASQIKG